MVYCMIWLTLEQNIVDEYDVSTHHLRDFVSVPLPGYAAFIHYIQHLLTHVVDVLYINKSWSIYNTIQTMYWKKPVRIYLHIHICAT